MKIIRQKKKSSPLGRLKERLIAMIGRNETYLNAHTEIFYCRE